MPLPRPFLGFTDSSPCWLSPCASRSPRPESCHESSLQRRNVQSEIVAPSSTSHLSLGRSAPTPLTPLYVELRCLSRRSSMSTRPNPRASLWARNLCLYSPNTCPHPLCAGNSTEEVPSYHGSGFLEKQCTPSHWEPWKACQRPFKPWWKAGLVALVRSVI